jgi:subtilase family serine protease
MKRTPTAATIIILSLTLIVTPAFASAVTSVVSDISAIHMNYVQPGLIPLAGYSGSNSPVGGAPFCHSGPLGTLLCYTPAFLKTAYDFPSTTGKHGLDGTGSTIVIVDAYGSPTVQSDLNKYDTTFGLPATTITILCGPTWTGAPTDNCPVKSIADFTTAQNASACSPPGWADETTLDVTMAHALAPGAKIVLVVANSCFDTDLYGAEMAVVTQHQYMGSIMSQSFGEPDDLVTCTQLDPTGTYCIARDPTLVNLPNSVYRTATNNHWTILASSGDWGANTAFPYTLTEELTPGFPATSPLVLSAGGTQGNPYGGQYGPPPGPGGNLSCPAHTNCNTGLVIINGGANGCTTAPRPAVPSSCVPVGYGGEAAWNEFDYFGFGTATGGGVSSLYNRPFYQIGTPRTYTTLLGASVKATGRTTPDVSFNAAATGGWLSFVGYLNGTAPGVPLCSTVAGCPGDWVIFSGTSAASPAWAGIMALVDQAAGRSVGFVNPALYLIGAIPALYSYVFHDITVGNNSASNGEAFALFFPPSTIVPFPAMDGFVATPGYDLTTGLGTPNVAHLIQTLALFGA